MLLVRKGAPRVLTASLFIFSAGCTTAAMRAPSPTLSRFDDLVVSSTPNGDPHSDIFLIQNISKEKSYLLHPETASFRLEDKSFQTLCGSRSGKSGSISLKPGEKTVIACHTEGDPQGYLEIPVDSVAADGTVVQSSGSIQTPSPQPSASPSSSPSAPPSVTPSDGAENGSHSANTDQAASGDHDAASFLAIHSVPLESGTELVSPELLDWKSHSTGSSATLGSHCGLNYEMRLQGSPRANFLYLNLESTTHLSALIKVSQMNVQFSEEAPEAPGFPYQPQDLTVAASGRLVMAIPFPNKWEFESHRKITVSIPVSNSDGAASCSIEAVFTREPDVDADSETYVERSDYDFSAGFGSAFARTGNLKAIGSDTGLSIDITFHAYPSVSDGFFIKVLGENYGAGNPSLSRGLISPYSGTSVSSYLVSAFYGGGYSHRFFLSSDWQLIYDIGGGGEVVGYHNDGNVAADAISNSFSGTQSISFDHRLGGARFHNVDSSLGISIYQVWTPSGALKSIPTDGNSFGLLLHYKLGV